MKSEKRKITETLIGTILLAIAQYFFYINYDIAAGGVAGLSIVLGKTASFMTPGQWQLVLNIILLIAGYLVMGKKFISNTVMSSVVLSITIVIFEKLFPSVDLGDDLVIIIFFGVLLASLGMSLIFANEASSGGTDIIGAIIHKYAHISIAAGVMIIDLIVCILSIAEFGIVRSMYAIFGVIITGRLTDFFMQGFSRKIQIFVISNKIDEINAKLLKDYDRGVTLLRAKGGYRQDDKLVLFTIVPTRLYPVIRDDILTVDNEAFIFTTSISEVYGEGFTREP